MSRADEFLNEFNKLDMLLKKKANIDTWTHSSIRSTVDFLVDERKDRVVKEFEGEIHQFIQLRNAIVHKTTKRAIAEPYDETVDKLRKLVATIEKPITAWDIATKELVTISMNDNLSDVIRLMVQNKITSLPVVENKQVRGFVSERTIVKIVDKSFEESGAIIEEAKVRDIVFDDPYGDDFDLYSYVEKKVTIYEVEDMFNDAIKRGKRLLAILVTERGDEKSTPMGIITAWDLYNDKRRAK